MAYAVLNVERDKPVQMILVDSAEDIADLPTDMAAGTIAEVVDGSATYRLSPSKVWTLVTGPVEETPADEGGGETPSDEGGGETLSDGGEGGNENPPADEGGGEEPTAG